MYTALAWGSDPGIDALTAKKSQKPISYLLKNIIDTKHTSYKNDHKNAHGGIKCPLN
jgi:hypothetical protein